MHQLNRSLETSSRRYFVDKFFIEHSTLISVGSKVIDIGGKKEKKRGAFNIDEFGADVTYANIDQSTGPDVLAPAENLPLPDESFDLAIMGELLEHVPDPRLVLKEAYRVLKSGGRALITIPFMYPVHADPYDFGRYTETFLKEESEKAGFSIEEIEQQGAIFAVLALMVQHLFSARGRSWRPIQNPLIRFLMYLDQRTTSKKLKSWTTGYGLVLKK